MLAPKVKWKYYAGGALQGNPLVADFDGDGLKEIFIQTASRPYKFICLNGDGTEKWVRDVTEAPLPGSTGFDIDGDGKVEILVATKSLMTTTLRCLNSDGTERWADPAGACNRPQPIVIDIDNDGELEILYSTFDGFVRCLRADGTLKWETRIGPYCWTGNAAADIDNDGQIETLWGTGRYMSGCDAELVCLNADGTERWRRFLAGDPAFANGISLGDIDNDGYKEILVAEYVTGTLFAFKYDGTEIWRTKISSRCFGLHTAIADVDHDGVVEVLRGTPTGLVCLDGRNGYVKWRVAETGLVDGAPSIADIDNDGELEILAGGLSGILHCIRPDGSEKWRFATGGPLLLECIGIDDIDGDGMVELIQGSDDGYLYALEEPIIYTLTISSTLGGITEPLPGSYPHAEGTTVEVTAIPEAGYVFDHWEGDIAGSENPATFRITQDMTITAVFSEIIVDPEEHAVTISVVGNGTTAPLPGAHAIIDGTSLTVTAYPSDGWQFDHWEGNISGIDNPTTFIVSTDMVIIAVFTEIVVPTYTLAISVVGQGTTNPASGSWNYLDGAEVSVSAIPDAGWQFDHWEGDISTEDNPVSLLMTSDLNIVAVFSEIIVDPEEHAVTISIIGEGTTDPLPGAYAVAVGAILTVTAYPAKGWVFDHWEGDVSGAMNPMDVEVLTDISIVAVFTEKPAPPSLWPLGIGVGGFALVAAIIHKIRKRR